MSMLPKRHWLSFSERARNLPIKKTCLSRVSRTVEMNLRSALCNRLQHLSIPYYTGSKIGILQNKVMRDVENIEGLTRMLVETLPGIIFSIGTADIVPSLIPSRTVTFYYISRRFSTCQCFHFI